MRRGGEGGGGVYPGSWHEARKRGGGVLLGAPRMYPLHPTPQISGILAWATTTWYAVRSCGCFGIGNGFLQLPFRRRYILLRDCFIMLLLCHLGASLAVSPTAAAVCARTVYKDPRYA